MTKYWQPDPNDPISSAMFKESFNSIEKLTTNSIGKGIVSGFTNGGTNGLTVAITGGSAIFAGGNFEFAGNTLNLNANSTNHIYLSSVYVPLSKTYVAQLFFNTSGVEPNNSIKLGTAVTNSNSITSVNLDVNNGRAADLKTLSYLSNQTFGSGGNSFSLNNLVGNVTLAQGNGISVTPSGNSLIVANTLTPFTLNTLSGNVNLNQGTGISITPSGNSLTIANTQNPFTLNTLSGAVNLNQGSGIVISASGNNLTVTNSQPIFTLNNLSGPVTIVQGTGISISNSGNTLTVSNTQAGGSGTSGTVTSVDVNGGTTGLTFNGGPVTNSGTITASGTLSLTNGGTSATTANQARMNIMAAPIAWTILNLNSSGLASQDTPSVGGL